MAIAVEIELWTSSKMNQFEIFDWCIDHFGECAVYRNRIEDVDGKRWSWTSNYNHCSFRFANERDATLFRLMWSTYAQP